MTKVVEVTKVGATCVLLRFECAAASVSVEMVNHRVLHCSIQLGCYESMDEPFSSRLAQIAPDPANVV